nr:cytochrome p450 [Quercus suber]
MIKQACSKPIELSDDIVPRVLPFEHHTVKHYGKNSFTWLGPRPRVNIMSPEQIKDVFTKMGDFQKPKPNPLTRLLAMGLISYKGNENPLAAVVKDIESTSPLQKEASPLPISSAVKTPIPNKDFLASEVSVYGENHHEQDTSYVNGSSKHIQKTHSHATNL